MTMHDLLVQILNKRYDALMSEYAFMHTAGSPEQERVAEELDMVAWELDTLRNPVSLPPTQDDNWGNNALAILHRADRAWQVN